MSEKRTEIHLTNRNELVVRGVKEVLSFDESCASLVTEDGELQIEGADVRILDLDTTDGEVRITGRISSLYFEEDTERKHRGIWGRLFG